MEYTKLKNTEVKISKIAFGAWAIGGWMWGGADEPDAIKAIHKSIDLGISTIDTAAVYGFGKSEEIVGKAIKGKRDKVEIFTKFGLNWQNKNGEFFFSTKLNDGTPVDIFKYSSKDSVINECEKSLKLLNTDYIDLYQIHWPDGTTPIAETMDALNSLIKQGKIRAAGVCNYSKEQTAEALKNTNIVTNQVPYSMVKREIEQELVPYCIEKNIGILAYSPLQRGLLTGKIKPGYSFNEGDNRPATPFFKENNLLKVNAFLEKIKPVALKYNASLSQLVLNWTSNRPGILCVLAGARNPGQVEDNAGAFNFKLTQKEIEFINNELNLLALE